jgi:hypothetical protein
VWVGSGVGWKCVEVYMKSELHEQELQSQNYYDRAEEEITDENRFLMSWVCLTRDLQIFWLFGRVLVPYQTYLPNVKYGTNEYLVEIRGCIAYPNLSRSTENFKGCLWTVNHIGPTIYYFVPSSFVWSLPLVLVSKFSKLI